MIGKTISHYRILEKLGEGGMGVVYKAEDTKLERTVAIKFLPHHIAANSEERERFRIEAKAAAALNHPNIATIYSIEEANDEIFIAMEYIEGRELKEIVGAHRDVPLPVDETLNYATQIAEGLNAAHKKGIVHRDIKSANIMITDEGLIKIMDFGLAKVRGGAQVTKVGTTLGTASYMSPEQARGEEADVRSDIWSFGVVLYEMLTGRLPFPGDYEQAVIYGILNEEPEFQEEVPGDLQQILNKMLVKNPSDRYQDMGNILTDLNTAAGLKTVKKLKRGNRPNRALMFAVLAAILLVVATAIFWNSFLSDNSASKSEIKRIAVLPLENLGTAEQEYFADGITGEITSRLSGLSGLSVIARSSAMKYKKTTKSLQQIGEELNVDYVLEGTLQWEEDAQGGKRIRVNPELIKIADATQVWSQPYEADFSSAFKLQVDIAGTVAEALNITLVKSEQQSLLGELTNNSKAYDVYLRALENMIGIGDEKRMRIAQELFLKAIALDSSFAVAYARLSTVQSDMYWFYFERSEENLAESKTNAQRALTLAPNLSEAHVAMGNYYYHGKLEYEPAIQEYNKAISLQPNNTDALARVGAVLRRQGKMREALENFRRAFDFDPRNGRFARLIGGTYSLLREYDSAEQWLDRAILLAPDDIRANFSKARSYLLSHGDTKAARTVIETALRTKIGVGAPSFKYIHARCDVLEGNFVGALTQLAGIGKVDDQFTFKPEDLLVAQVYGLMKNESLAHKKYDSARQVLERKIAEDPQDSRLYSSRGLVYAGLGQKADAIKAGKRGVELLPISKEAWRGGHRLLDLTQIYTMTDEPDLALEILDDLLGRPTNTISVALLRIDPTWEPLREHLRYQQLLEKYSGEASK